MNQFVQANPQRCIGCRTCMIACVVAHEGKRIFEIDPDGYAFNPRLFMVKTPKLSAPVQCRHCENPACKQACTSGAISVKDGAVVINTAKCIGCKNCVIACPFGAVEIVETVSVNNGISGIAGGGYATTGNGAVAGGAARKVANKCDLCAGVADKPSCTRVCPTETLKLVTTDAFAGGLTAKREDALRAAAV